MGRTLTVSALYLFFFLPLCLLAFEGVSSQLAAPAAVPAACCHTGLHPAENSVINVAKVFLIILIYILHC